MRAGLPDLEPRLLQRWAEMNLYERLRQKGRNRAEVPAARRPALRQRQHPHRPRAQQDPQGSRRQIAGHARLRFQLRAGLGLPRPADRVEDRGELSRQGPQQGRGADQRVPRRVPRVRRALDRRAARGVQAPRRRRRLGASLQDHGLPGRGDHRRRDHEVRHERHALSRLQAGDVVGGREDGAGRGRGRVPGLSVRHDLGEVSGRSRCDDRTAARAS